MKSLLSLCCALFVVQFGAASASAQFPSKRKFYALSFARNGDVVAAVNVKVKPNGVISGNGSYVDFASIRITGAATDDGSFEVTEYSSRDVPPYTGKFSTDGNSFTATISTGNTIVGKRVPDGFKVAGVYHAALDVGLKGLFIVTSERRLVGAVYNPRTREVVAVSGSASTTRFSGTSEDGVDFRGTISGSTVKGTYSDGAGFEGRFSGSRYGF